MKRKWIDFVGVDGKRGRLIDWLWVSSDSSCMGVAFLADQEQRRVVSL